VRRFLTSPVRPRPSGCSLRLPMRFPLKQVGHHPFEDRPCLSVGAGWDVAGARFATIGPPEDYRQKTRSPDSQTARMCIAILLWAIQQDRPTDHGDFSTRCRILRGLPTAGRVELGPGGRPPG